MRGISARLVVSELKADGQRRPARPEAAGAGIRRRLRLGDALRRDYAPMTRESRKLTTEQSIKGIQAWR